MVANGTTAVQLNPATGSSLVKIITVISSPFFWPYPHAQRRNFILPGEITSIASDVVYRVVNAGEVSSTDNFTRLTVNPEEIKVEVYSRKGRLLTSRVLAF